jgi:hypothetical protein
MAISFQSVVYRSPRRIRLVFSNTLAAGAFSASWFAVVSTDSLGVDPTVMAALVVAGSPNVVELVLSDEMASAGGYSVTASAGVPAADASTLLADTALPLRAPGTTPEITGPTVEARDDLYLYDLAFNGDDYVETGDGDLEVTSGVPNVEAALTRRLISEGLQWSASYGAKAREYVDGPSTALPELRAALINQALLDPRVKAADAKLLLATDGSYYFSVEAQLVGNLSIQTHVPVRTS